MSRLLCRLGWHKWQRYEVGFAFASWTEKACPRCGTNERSYR